MSGPPAGVTIFGTNFGATQGGSTVLLNGNSVAVNAWTDTAITFTVPSGATSGSYPYILRLFHRAGKHAGIGPLATHALRHSYRSWLDAVGTPIAVQQKLTRHSDIRTTMNLYGDVVTDEMAQAHSKIVGLALTPTETS